MKHFLLVFLLQMGLLPAFSQKKITGYFPENTSGQIHWEQQFDQQLDPANIGSTIEILSAYPHHLSSAQDKINAEYIQQQFTDYGWDAKIETFYVLFPSPKERQLELVAPTKYTALLKEPAIKEDPTSGQKGQLPTYNAYSADGDVTAGLVFVNYGLPDDYEVLDKMGISVKGKIVIAKYGRSWRGTKPKVAQEHGAVGCIIYSDPIDDGYFAGDVYPEGPFKNEYGVQRGSVMDMVYHPGDPLTPGYGALKDAKRIDRTDAITILKIPVLPISYHDAAPLLKSLGGPAAPRRWHGGLPFAYHIGPGETKVHLKLAFNWDIVPCYNVIATMRGSELPDEWVIRGNHHDAWVNGAADPVSGLAAMMEEAKAIGELAKMGWKPKRTLVYCAWDGEEQGLLGSTEWVEQHMKELQQKAVVYINTDGNGRGFLYAGGSHALEPFMTEISKSVIDPQTNISVFERKMAYNAVHENNPEIKTKILENDVLKLGAMGSGSDYSSFIQHAGIPALNLGFGGEDHGGEYHSIYDSYHLYALYKDPGFQYGKALAQVAGRCVLRMANADVLPFRYSRTYKTIMKYVDEVEALAESRRKQIAAENLLIEKGSYKAAFDPTKHWNTPSPKPPVPYLDFSFLKNAMVDLQMAVDVLNKRYSTVMKSDKVNDTFNRLLYHGEQQLLADSGLPRRPWYRHLIYAPGFYTGYGVKTLPGIREAIEQGSWEEAQREIGRCAAVIRALAEHLSSRQ